MWKDPKDSNWKLMAFYNYGVSDLTLDALTKIAGTIILSCLP